jgi:transposase
MPHGKELSAELRGQIVGMAKSDKSSREIGNQLGIPHTTIAYTIRRYKENSSNIDRKRSGRPAVLTERSKNLLRREAKRNRFKPLKEITNQLPVKVSVTTSRKALNERGLHHHVAAKKPLISAQNIQRRKDWCGRFGNWPEEEWQKVIWSDESTVELNLSSRKIMVWRSQGERYQADNLAANQRSGRISVMFWSCFWQNELGPLVALPKGGINSHKYCEILEEHLFPFYQAVKAVLDEPWFMDDNCKIHTSAVTRAFEEELGIRCLEWPSQSPDLNPIENLWKLWKDNIQKITPPPSNRQELIAAAQDAWEQLKVTDIGQALADSIQRRIQAVKAVKGHPTKY